MMGKAHTAVLERAAEAAGGHYGQLLLRQRHWIERRAAGRFNDGVLRDWHYKKTPQTVWCVRRLTRAILDSPADDESRTAFLLHWVSHYFVDAIWTCHVAQRYMEGASALEQKEFDNGIEYEVEEIVDGPAFDAPRLDGRGYWTLFWQGRLESDRRSRPLLDAWARRDGYLDIALESVPYCVASFAAYLNTLNVRRQGVPASGTGKRTGPPTRNSDAALAANAWVVALDRALEQMRPVQEVLDTQPRTLVTGAEIDAQLDERGAAYGTGTPDLAHWSGEWVLAQDLSGEQLAERVFTPEFAEHIARMRGYDRSIEQDEQAGRPSTPAAIADRDRQVATMYAWLARWDVAVMPPQAVPRQPNKGA
ncbi:MAG: hypothetical protein AVDCRST_MAG77-2644 [uncultured Chloroflexi bacterium]|uniref:Uncharacterized protein n=1 Tax=uncultured Chloroflexota bacterium TaxID=166587 RepID=A0A6J4ISG2_9CHLR|nr:MAG: hypothetical protein AVDCRST_MAG77-2644 [uncultured Chloroflexota bacterium]